MKSFFEPKSVAVAGVSTDPDKLGSIIFENLEANRKKGLLRATVYALNPAHASIRGNDAYPSIGSLPAVPDLLIVAVPESQTEALITDAADAGVKAAIIVTSGYAETGKKDVEERIAGISEESGMRIIGPNTIGVVDMKSGVDSLFLRSTKQLLDGREVPSLLRPLKGNIVVITQSGHLGQAVVEELAANEVGIRALVGTGNQVDVSAEDVLEYFADDPETKAIAMYVEGVRDGRKFMEVARRVSRTKPVVALKVGRTGSGARAALTHTASMVGDYDVYRTALRQAGVIEARGFQELVDFAIALSMLPRPHGNKLAVITNAGGVGALASDEAQDAGLAVVPPNPRVVAKLRSRFRGSGFVPNASLVNPFDVTATASTDELVGVVEEVSASKEYDMLLVIPTHQAPAIGPEVSQKLVDAVRGTETPVCMCVVGRADLAMEIQRNFMRSVIPSFPTPERAVRALAARWLHSEITGQGDAHRAAVVRPRRKKWKPGQLTHQEAAGLLKDYGLAEPRSVTLRSPEDFSLLELLSYPVACKLLSKDLPHKTDVGGVALGVEAPGQARNSFALMKKLAERKGARFDGVLVQEMVGRGIELILGGKRDPVFGPVVALGLGGTYVELSKEVSLAIAPVTPAEFRFVLKGTKLENVIQGYRGGPRAQIGRLCKTVSAFSKMIAENPALQEVEVNPLIATMDAVVAVDIRALALG